MANFNIFIDILKIKLIIAYEQKKVVSELVVHPKMNSGRFNYIRENLFKCGDTFLLKPNFPVVHN